MKVYVVRCYLKNANEELDSIWATEAAALKRVVDLTAEWIASEADKGWGDWSLDEIDRGITYTEFEVG